jgi:hypothetical protein
MKFADYWDKIILINRAVRTDRLRRCGEIFRVYGMAEKVVLFEAHEGTMLDGSFSGNHGCTASHRGVLELVAHEGWNRVLVLEDDFEPVEPGLFPQDAEGRAMGRKSFEQQWTEIVPHIPPNWELLYIAGHYAEKPKARVAPHIIRTRRMLTTSSYGITAVAARIMAPHIYGVGPIDNLFHHWNERMESYCVSPRLIVQRPDMSDLHHQPENYVGAMLADVHGDGWKLSEI